MIEILKGVSMEYAPEKVILSDEVVEDFIRLMETARDVQFEIGDKLIEQVELHNKSKNEVISYLAGILNVSATVLYDYYRVAERWSPEHREIYQSLDWTIYRNSDPIEDAELLDKAIDEGWNSTRFKEEKYPALKEPRAVLERVKSMLIRHKADWRPEVKSEIDFILDRLEKLLKIYAT